MMAARFAIRLENLDIGIFIKVKATYQAPVTKSYGLEHIRSV
jgi:hypothetical protein